MNYLEIINKCLVELNYKQVSAFSELIKNDHNKLKNIVNIINTEVCNSSRWNFLQRTSKFILPKDTGEIDNNIDGRIDAVIIDGVKLDFCPEYQKFFVDSQPYNSYSLYNDKILFPIFNTEKEVEVLYYTKKCAKDSDGKEKYNLEADTDESLIPNSFLEPLLVYGSCMRLKGNPQHIRFNYWLKMYNDALANMRSLVSLSMDETPSVKMHRK